MLFFRRTDDWGRCCSVRRDRRGRLSFIHVQLFGWAFTWAGDAVRADTRKGAGSGQH